MTYEEVVQHVRDEIKRVESYGEGLHQFRVGLDYAHSAHCISSQGGHSRTGTWKVFMPGFGMNVARSAGQRHEDDHAAGSVTERGYNDDRAVTVDVVAGGKSELRTPFEPILLVLYAGEESAKIHVSAFPDELVFLPRHPHRHTGKVGQPADVIPMRMGQ